MQTEPWVSSSTTPGWDGLEKRDNAPFIVVRGFLRKNARSGRMADIALYSPWCPNLIARRLGSGEPETVCAQVLRSAIIN